MGPARSASVRLASDTVAEPSMARNCAQNTGPGDQIAWGNASRFGHRHWNLMHGTVERMAPIRSMVPGAVRYDARTNVAISVCRGFLRHVINNCRKNNSACNMTLTGHSIGILDEFTRQICLQPTLETPVLWSSPPCTRSSGRQQVASRLLQRHTGEHHCGVPLKKTRMKSTDDQKGRMSGLLTSTRLDF